ncbi:hypothetical protein B0T11DRAFT_347691 [Plectosphaerella cucumerina]|uniref:Glucose-methanol-choline oxidoreductase N-terminal domain-containing protein n=1 Tax=Plectosphaerella cucumerina TaxID=40658 RepID=A0A8K0TVF9_9PEZI|nr:hypothetical protein B0T11DRAFT_347691 [Plectosphaerella cucumerina]
MTDADFIVVGAGPAGCSVASALARSRAQPRILLLEAGGPNNDIDARNCRDRYTRFTNQGQAVLYSSEPVSSLYHRRIRLSQGRGLGGSSAINFTIWHPGAEDDMDFMSEVTGDPAWSWKSAVDRFKKLERFLTPSHPDQVESEVLATMKRWSSYGCRINQEAGDGSHIGLTIPPSTSYRGVRSTAADLLFPTPFNLHIVTNAPVHRVLFQGRTAHGVKLIDGRVFTAAREVVLCAGALGTPKILLLSGIRPARELHDLSIPVVHDNEFVGQGYRDHALVALRVADDAATNRAAFFGDPVRQDIAHRDWQLYRAGEYTHIGSSVALGFFKSDAVLSSPEFRGLPRAEQERLLRPTIPTYEVAMNTIPASFYDGSAASSKTQPIHIFIMNSQATGKLQVLSADPEVPLSIRLSILEHPFDKRVAVEATKEVLQRLGWGPSRSGLTKLPASDSDSDILDFWARYCLSSCHGTGTTKMGPSQQSHQSCVDYELRVHGVRNLRVGDLGVLPFLPSTHPQTWAYQVGMILAEKLIREHDLDEVESPYLFTFGNLVSGGAAVAADRKLIGPKWNKRRKVIVKVARRVGPVNRHIRKSDQNLGQPNMESGLC